MCVLFLFGFTPCSAQGLLLIQCSVVTPGVAGDQTWMNHMQGTSLAPLCSPQFNCNILKKGNLNPTQRILPFPDSCPFPSSICSYIPKGGKIPKPSTESRTVFITAYHCQKSMGLYSQLFSRNGPCLGPTVGAQCQPWDLAKHHSLS